MSHPPVPGCVRAGRGAHQDSLAHRTHHASWNGQGNRPFDGNITGCFFFHH